MTGYRIVEFHSGEFAIEKTFKLFWIWEIGTGRFRDLRSAKEYYWSRRSVHFTDCLTKDVNHLKTSTPKYEIKRIVKQTKLEKVLE